MDAAPLNTSIIILCSEVGFTFGNEIVQMLSKICDVKELNENLKFMSGRGKKLEPEFSRTNQIYIYSCD